MRRLLVICIALVLVASACDRLPFVGGGGEERTVLVDYSHDEFASALLFNFPRRVTAAPGMTLDFRQTWTGEAHTVTGGGLANERLGTDVFTFGRAFDELLARGVDVPDPTGPTDDTVGEMLDAVEESRSGPDRDAFLDSYDALADEGIAPDRDDADEVPVGTLFEKIGPAFEGEFSQLPIAWDTETGELNQNVGQPCYLDRGAPPKDPDEACDSREQPAFNGKQSFYNSGIIPYEGPQGNTFRVPLADDIAPGNYFFYCAIHFFAQYTEVEVVPSGTDVPTQEEVNRQAREEIDLRAKPLAASYRDVVRRQRLDAFGQTLRGPFAGAFPPKVQYALINEFIPKNLSVRRNEPITWTFLGLEHTISFGVPRYFPIVQFLDDGTVRYNPKLRNPGGGAREPPEPEGAPQEEPPAPLAYDAGTYDGEGFWSTGLVGADTYAQVTLRISRPGTYDFACLIHPPMVGEIEVT